MASGGSRALGLGPLSMTSREMLRQAFLPSHDERWPQGERLRWIYACKMFMLPLAFAGHLVIWLILRGDTSTVRANLDLTMATIMALIGVDVVLTVVFLRRERVDRAVFLVTAALEIAFSVLWVQATGSVTSYFISTFLILAFMYRLIANYWAGLTCIVTGAVGILGAYLLEEAGVLPRASVLASDAAAAVVPEAFREIAFISFLNALAINFVGMNLLARAFERGRVALEEARAELRAVVDEARLGRLSGTRFGAYRLDELLGRGGMGEVYAARRDDGAPIAVKVLHAHLGADTTARARFRREAELVRRLPSASVARVLDVGTTPDGADYIAMERLEGEDLGAMLRRRGRLPLDAVVTLAHSLADALADAHAAGIVHRDLKPSNIFLVGDRIDRIRLLDFGIARLYEASGNATLTETAAMIGSPGYMPPEQAVGDHDAMGPATDVFALGAILYRALTGQPAFPSRSPAAALYEALHHVPPPPSALAEVSRGVDRVLAVALAKDPAQRYGDPRVLAADLARAAGGDLLDELTDRATGCARAAPAAPTLTGAPIEPDATRPARHAMWLSVGVPRPDRAPEES